MSKLVTMASMVTKNFAIFTQPAGVETAATARDENSDINAPLNDIGNHFDITHMHSAWDYLDAEIDEEVIVPHTAVAAGSAPPGMNYAFAWHASAVDYALYEHNRGYPPLALAVLAGKRVHPGAPIRTGADGSARYCMIYCTDTHVRMREVRAGGNTGLSAENITYRVIVIPAPEVASGDEIVRWLPGTDVLLLSGGRWTSAHKFLHRDDSAPEFGFAKGKTMFGANGAVRVFSADGTYHDTVPVGLKQRISPGTGSYGPTLEFTGSPAAPEIIGMEVPT